MQGSDDVRREDGAERPPAANEYEDVFVEVSDRVERLLRRTIAIGLALLVGAQLLLAVPAVRQWAVKVERLEGVPFQRSGPDAGP